MKQLLMFQLSLICFLTSPIFAESAYRQNFPERRLMFDNMYGPPTYQQYSLPGGQVNPLAYQTPLYPRPGQSSMLPAPPAIFHDGALPIMNIYELHHPTEYTPTSPYGLPHIYNPYHALNLPYNYLQHPFAAQLMSQMSTQALASDPYAGTPMAHTNLYNPAYHNLNFRIAPVNPANLRNQGSKRQKLLK